MDDNRSTLPMWLGGILLALVLILISTRGGGIGNPRLIQQFTPKPTDPNAPTAQPFELPQIHLPSLPPNMRDVITSLRDRLAAGEAVPALTPVASGPRARVDVTDVRRNGDKVQVRGSVTNTTTQPLQIPPGAFSFRDSAGITYATGGSGSATLQPSQSTSFDLTVPLPSGRGLVLILTIPPDPALEQTLVVETKS